MSRKLNNISPGEKKLILSALEEAAKNFTGKEGAWAFINEVSTEREKMEMGRRLTVASLILSGQTYFEINELLQISPNTYSLVRKWLQKQIPGYANILRKSNDESNKRASSRKKKHYQRIDPFSFAAMKKKYPMHFLLFNIAEEIMDGIRK